jgi:hypothetical protein
MQNTQINSSTNTNNKSAIEIQTPTPMAITAYKNINTKYKNINKT